MDRAKFITDLILKAPFYFHNILSQNRAEDLGGKGINWHATRALYLNNEVMFPAAVD